MLSRDNIISTALLKIGEVSVYNDNRNNMYKIADKLLENVLTTVASRNDFLFNATTVELTKFGKDEITGEIQYNLPVDFLNKITFVNGLGRIENEYIFSTTEDLQLQYCKKIDFSDIPSYMLNYFIYALAVELAETYQQYIDRLPLLNQRLEQERMNIYRIEFRPQIKTF